MGLTVMEVLKWGELLTSPGRVSRLPKGGGPWALLTDEEELAGGKRWGVGGHCSEK